MEGTKTWVIAIIALIVGAAGGYFYTQGHVGELTEQASTLETQLAEATEKAQGAASEIESLKADLEDKTKQIEDQSAKIVELEAASKETMTPTPQ